VQLCYREPHWPVRKVVPYQVELDGAGDAEGRLIFAPADHSWVIRAEGDQPEFCTSLPRTGGDAAAALAALEAELEVARQLPGVQRLEGPRPMIVAEQDKDLLEGPLDSTGPFVIEAWIRGPNGSVYDCIYRIRLKMNSAWPRCTPEVRFCNHIVHPWIKHDGMVEDDELATAIKEAKEEGMTPLCAVLDGVRSLLPSIKSDELSATEAAGGGLAAFAENSCTTETVAAYSQQRLHPRLFDTEQGWDNAWFDPAFLAAAARYKDGKPNAWKELMQHECFEVYSFPMFTEEFCEMLMDEMFNYEATGLRVRRPNNMNKYGLILNGIGFEPMLDGLQREILQPISHEMFPGIGSQFEKHHSFIVRYKLGEDLGLDMHTDDSEVTFNICLGKDFKGAGLQVCGNQASAGHRKATLVYKHVKGRCLLHLGHRRHGADDITEGERLNLIIWNQNYEYRRSNRWTRFHQQGRQYEKETGPPDRVCLSYTHDRDYGAYKEYTEEMKAHRMGAWCPPRFAEYDEFPDLPKIAALEASTGYFSDSTQDSRGLDSE